MDLVLAAQTRLATGHLLHRIAADLLDVLFLVLFLVVGGVFVALVDATRLDLVVRRLAGLFRLRRGIGLGNCRVALIVDGERMGFVMLRGGFGVSWFSSRLGRGCRRFRRRNRLRSLGEGLVLRLGGGGLDLRRLAVGGLLRFALGGSVDFRRRRAFLGQRGGFGNLLVRLGTLARLVIAAAAAAAAARTLLLLLLDMRGGFFLKQRLPVGDRDLVIIRMDFGEGEEAVPVAAVIDEGGLQGRFDPCHLRQIDVAAQRLLGGGFEIEFFDAITSEHHHPGFFRMGCVDQHFVGHGKLFGAFRRAAPHVLSGRMAAVAGVRGSAGEQSRAMFEDEERLKKRTAVRLAAQRRSGKRSASGNEARAPWGRLLASSSERPQRPEGPIATRSEGGSQRSLHISWPEPGLRKTTASDLCRDRQALASKGRALLQASLDDLDGRETHLSPALPEESRRAEQT